MKRLSKLKLNQLNKAEMEKRELYNLKGGGTGPCACGCCYSGGGGSSSHDNGQANCTSGLNSTCGDPVYHYCW